MDFTAQKSPKERAELFIATESASGINSRLVEKDFWVCWTLYRLFDVLRVRPQMIFKGGTSLSKAYKAIDRFSEDVDLSFSRKDLGFTADDLDPEAHGIGVKERRRRLDALSAKCAELIREHLLQNLRRDFKSVMGDANWSLELDTDDTQTVIFTYPQSDITSAAAGYVRSAIRLELGARSDDWPASDEHISPIAAEKFSGAFEVSICRIRTLAIARTFWEKATLLHAEYNRPADKPSKERLSRHYYDLHCLYKRGFADEALKDKRLLKRVVEHKSLFFQSAWAHYDTAKPGTFHLVPSEERMAVIRRDYDLMRVMIFGTPPDWDVIVSDLKDLESQINSK